MPGIHVINVPLPRVVTGVPRGGRRQAEPHAVLEDYPLAVASVSRTEAPVALSRTRRYGKGGDEPWRILDGRLYRPMRWQMINNEMPDEGMPPEDFASRVLPQMRQYAGLRGDTANVPGDRLLQWGRWTDGLKDNGIVPVAEKPFRVVVDDGRPRQAALAEALARNLLSVDGLLYVRAPAPLVRAHPTGIPGSANVYLQDHVRDWPTDDRVETPWDGFPVHRTEEILAYASRVAADVGAERRAAEWTFSIHEPDLLDGAYDLTPGRRARHMAAGLAGSTAKHLSLMGDDAIRAWMRLRSAGAGETAEPAGVLADVATLAVACDPEPGSLAAGLLGDGKKDLPVAAAEARRMLHLSAFLEGPGLDLAEADDLALSGIGI